MGIGAEGGAMPRHDEPFDILDPARCGEDLFGNLRLAAAIAPSLCRGCADYHIRCTAHRAAGETMGVEMDRPPLVALLKEEIAARLDAAPAGADIDIVIAGSADTGVLSTVAHAAALLGPESLARCRFTVLDLCPTPLRLCRAYAGRHGIRLATEAVDLLAPHRSFAADILVLHSLFRFLPTSAQEGVLAGLASWLKPGGALVFSHRIKSLEAAETAADSAKRRRANDRVAATLALDPALADLDWAAIMPRLVRSMGDDQHRAGEFRSEAALRGFLARSPLRLERFDAVSRTIGEASNHCYLRKRILALLRRSAPSEQQA
jgi:hypothetical protein